MTRRSRAVGSGGFNCAIGGGSSSDSRMLMVDESESELSLTLKGRTED